jgi:hypothetical protein
MYIDWRLQGEAIEGFGPLEYCGNWSKLPSRAR